MPHILIVDDNPKNIQVLGTMLRPQDYRIGIANDGMTALSQIAKVKPDLILLDIMMPQMSGFEVCEKLKTNPETREIPIIFLTAKTEIDDIVKGFELGAVDYVTKPFNSTELLSRIKTHLDLKQKTDLIKRINQNQNQLLHVLCHDLTNPISAVSNFLQMFPENEYSRCMDLATRNCLKIIDIVRMILALEENKFVLEIKKENLRQLVDESLSILDHQFKSKELEIEVDISPNIFVAVEKTSFINSVISNLLTNAIKFSYPESLIKVSAITEDKTTELLIEDSGIGMNKKILEDLFNLNKSTRRQGTGGETGTGFGMPLVRRFISAYGGTLNIKSKDVKNYPEDHGTTVTLRLNSDY